jgi:Holliday junction resolvase
MRQPNPAHSGARYELVVAADLMRQGFEVYRNVPPSGCTDLIARKGEAILLRVQVKGSSSCVTHVKGNDVLASFPKSGGIRYRVIDERLVALFERAETMSYPVLLAIRRRLTAYNIHDYSEAQ